VVHDHFRPYAALDAVDHAFCNAHHRRELQALIDIDKEVWALDMRAVRLDAAKAVRQAKEAGESALGPQPVQGFVDRSWQAVRAGLSFHRALPAFDPSPNSKKRQKQRPGHNLLIRFKTFKDEINSNVLAYEPSPGKMTELFQSGQAVLAVWGTGRVQSFANTGFPVDFAYPKEGAVTLLTTACPIIKPNASPLASSFVKRLLEPKIQLVMLKDYGYGPVLKSVVVPPELGKMAPIGERAAKLYTADWSIINDKREEWTKRWNREVER